MPHPYRTPAPPARRVRPILWYVLGPPLPWRAGGNGDWVATTGPLTFYIYDASRGCALWVHDTRGMVEWMVRRYTGWPRWLRVCAAKLDARELARDLVAPDA